MKYYVLIFSALVLVACGRNKSAETDLSRAKSFMRLYPDSALCILERLDPSKIPKGSTVAQYSLLYSEALDKNAIDLASDSLIRPAVEYYKHHGSKIDKAKSWYYLARIYENNGDIDNAVRSYVEAQKYMVETRAHRLLAMLYANVGNLYVQQNSFEDAERMYDEAISAYQGLNTVNEAYVMCDKARLLHLKAQQKQALAVLEQAESIAIEHDDSGCLLNIAHSKAAILSDMGEDIDNQEQVIHLIFSAYDKYNDGKRECKLNCVR